jgi:hypothetical protein
MRLLEIVVSFPIDHFCFAEVSKRKALSHFVIMYNVVMAGYDYDVALSFAGEDRTYVEEVANILHQLGVKVFYDRYEEADLWGKDLYVHLDDVYQRNSRYCVVFISKHYKEKLWTNHERESAQARAFQQKGEYILPARLDETEIPGIRVTTGYINLTKKTPSELAYLITQKLGLNAEIEEMIAYLKHYLVHALGRTRGHMNTGSK